MLWGDGVMMVMMMKNGGVDSWGVVTMLKGSVLIGM